MSPPENSQAEGVPLPQGRSTRYSHQAINCWGEAHPPGEGSLLYAVYRFTSSPPRQAPLTTTPRTTLDQRAGRPLRLAPNVNHQVGREPTWGSASEHLLPGPADWAPTERRLALMPAPPPPH